MPLKENQIDLIRIGSILILALLLRLLFALNIPLSGDESTGILLATGQAYSFIDRLPQEIVPLKQLTAFLNISKDFGIPEMIRSLTYGATHPPLYHLIQRFIVQFAGHDYLPLRLTSLLISLGSIGLIYLIGEKIYNKRAGALAALFSTLCPYGNIFASAVRPYPLIAFIALLATLLAYQLSEDTSPAFNKKKLFFFTLVCVAGFYTLYSFLFVFIALIFFLILDNARNRGKIFALFCTSAAVGVLYLPWLPSFLIQSKIVMQQNYYFIGTGDLLEFINIFYSNFTKYISEPIILPVQFMVGGIIFVGLYTLGQRHKGRVFLLSFLVYLLTTAISDCVFKIHTLDVPKLNFFLTPVLFIIFAIGISRLPSRYFLKGIVLIIFSVSLLWSSGQAYFKHAQIIDGPIGLLNFRDKVAEFSQPGTKSLILVNTRERRYLLSIAGAVKIPVDIKIFSKQDLRHLSAQLKNIKNYDIVLLTNWYVPYRRHDSLSSSNIRIITNYLEKSGFTLIESPPSGANLKQSTFYIFKQDGHGDALSQIIAGVMESDNG